MRLAFALAGIALALAHPLASQQTLNLRDADVRAFIQDAARVTGRNFIIDSRVQGKVSVVSDRPLSRSEYFEVFLSTLRANGLIAVPTANGYRIQPADTAATQPGRIGSAGAGRNQFVTEVFRLRSIEASSAVETLRPLVSREGSVTANRAGNSLVVADYADNIRRIRQLLERIDSEGAATELIALKNAGAREIAASLQALATGGQASGAPTSVAVVAIDSSNSIALRGDRGTVARFAAIARDLDKRAESGTEIRVLWLKHAEAEKLLPVLQQLVGQAVTASPSAASTGTPTSGNAPAQPAPTPVATVGGGGSVGSGRAAPVIARYEGANAIIISASAEMQRTLGEVVNQLDTRREQVLVEAIIIEISDTAAKRLGVQFLLGSTNTGFAATNFSNTAPNLLTIAGAVGARELDRTTTIINGATVTTSSGSATSDQLAQAAVSSILGAAGGFGGIGTRLGDNGVFGLILNAVQQDNKSNILSTPSVLTLDNQEAKILVGQEIPITTGERLGDNFENAFRTVQRQNVGIQLEVKPQINAGGAIKLFIRQEVSSIAGPVTNNSADLILNKREIETTVTVDDGQIIALGGLLDDNERRTLEKIPLLGDIPGLGALFRSKARARNKTNLMVFIRPTILKTSQDSREFAERRYNYVREQQLLANPKREPSIDELLRDYMGIEPPIPPLPANVTIPPPQVITPEVRQSTQPIRPVEIPASDPTP